MNIQVLQIYLHLCQKQGVKESPQGLKHFEEVIVGWYVEECAKRNLTVDLESLRVACEKMIALGHQVV